MSHIPNNICAIFPLSCLSDFFMMASKQFTSNYHHRIYSYTLVSLQFKQIDFFNNMRMNIFYKYVLKKFFLLYLRDVMLKKVYIYC